NSSVPSAAKLKLDFSYDHRSRRTSKAVWTWNGSAYVGQSTNKFVYDDWNLTAELDHTNKIARSYLWGLDLSGSLQGAGGVGGLLAIKVTTNGAHFAALDGNGNVAALINATNATLSSQYDYSPFGELIRRTGSAAKTNPLRFSTKYKDEETDFLYSGFRYYTPSTGRWLSRDPIGQIGSLNLHAYVGNAPVDSFDPFGLCQGNGCVAMPAAAIPGFGFKNPLTGAHKSSCTWLEGKIRGYLSSKEDIRAWDRFVGGTGNDIELTDSEMASAVRAAADFQAGIKKLSEDCKVNPF